jgi:hypothetical protein
MFQSRQKIKLKYYLFKGLVIRACSCDEMCQLASETLNSVAFYQKIKFKARTKIPDLPSLFMSYNYDI